MSLAKLLANRDLKLAVAVGRSYGPTLDALLEHAKGSPHVYWRHGEDIYRSLFDMLMLSDGLIVSMRDMLERTGFDIPPDAAAGSRP